MTTDERILRLIASTCPTPIDLAALRPELVLRQDLGIDSIALVTMMFQFEQEFGVDLVDLEVDLSGIESVGDVLRKADEILAARPAHARS